MAASEQQAGNSEAGTVKRLYRSGVDRMICGVCGGVAEYFRVDPTLVRIIWALTIFVSGLGIIAYIISLIIIPENPEHRKLKPERRRKTQNSGVIWGVILIVLGFILLATRFDVFYYPFRWPFWRPFYFPWDIFWPLVIILFGLLYIFHVMRKGRAKEVEEVEEKPLRERRLQRSRRSRMIGGVCGGIADYFNIDPSFVRIGWVLATIFTNFLLGILAYIVMLIVIPEAVEEKAPVEQPISKKG